MGKKTFFARKTFVTEESKILAGIKFRECYQSNNPRFQTFANLPKKSLNHVSQKFLTLKYFGHG